MVAKVRGHMAPFSERQMQQDFCIAGRQQLPQLEKIIT